MPLRPIPLTAKTSLLLITFAFSAVAGFAQEAKAPAYTEIFDKKEVMIAARDGNKLHTEIYTPKNSKEPLPIIFERTPYGISAAG